MVSFLDRLAEKDAVAVSAITVAEVYKNVFPGELVIAEDFFTTHPVIPITHEIAKEGGLYWQQYVKRVKKLTITDCLIAATVKLQDFVLYTLNVRHFPMTDIKIGKPPHIHV